jgi:hypothetical protein
LRLCGMGKLPSDKIGRIQYRKGFGLSCWSAQGGEAVPRSPGRRDGGGAEQAPKERRESRGEEFSRAPGRSEGAGCPKKTCAPRRRLAAYSTRSRPQIRAMVLIPRSTL